MKTVRNIRSILSAIAILLILAGVYNLPVLPEQQPLSPASEPKGVISGEQPNAASDDYSREAFGSSWADLNHDCMDTRHQVLARDGSGVKLDADGCKVVAGRWIDPYTGDVITNPSDIDVDHVYPLAEAWRQGANEWTREQRIAFSNDPDNLMALSASVNRSKSDQNGSEWCAYQPGEKTKNECPAAGSKTDFTERYAAVESKYNLG